MSLLVPWKSGGGSADYERVDVVSSFSAGLNFEDGSIDHVYVNRCGKITYLDIQAHSNISIYLDPGTQLQLFKVASSEKRAIPYQNCPIVGRFIFDIGGTGKVAVCSVNYDSSNRTFYLADADKQYTIPDYYGMQIQCSFINSL